PPAGPATRPPSRNTLAVMSFVFGALWIGGLGSIFALVLARGARRQIRRTGQRGTWFARAGTLFGWLGLGLILAIALQNSS
ncbi:MAG: DUF4190 domain-containing protein, partial [Frankia sp.]